MGWRFVLTDLYGQAISELPGVDGKTVAMPIRSMATGAFQVNLTRTEADALVECATLLRVYEDVPDPTAPDRTVPRLHAHLQQVTGVEDATANGGTVTTTYADPAWELSRRLCGKSPAGYSAGSALVPVDRGAIIADLVNGAAAEAPLRLRMGSVAPSSSTYVADWFYKPVLEAVAELAAPLDGPDWRVRPIEYDNGIIGELDIAPVIGGPRLEAIFEFGGGLGNVANYQRTVSREGQANRAYHLPPGFPDPAAGAVLSADDPAAIARWGLLETVVGADLSVDQLRTSLLQRHIQVRGTPRQTITFTPGSSLTNSTRLRDPDGFDIGDMIQFRASIRRHGVVTPRLDGWFRAYQASVSVSREGVATTSLTVSPDAGGV